MNRGVPRNDAERWEAVEDHLRTAAMHLVREETEWAAAELETLADRIDNSLDTDNR